MTTREHIEKLIASRQEIVPESAFQIPRDHGEGEGGCGVIGMACSEQIAAKHMLQSLIQMRNRGNGKGGGIAAAGLKPEEFGVSRRTMDEDYLLAVAYLDEGVRKKVEKTHIFGNYQVDQVREQPQIADHREIAGLDVKPPTVVQYFVRPKQERLARFVETHDMGDLGARAVEDEYVYQNSYALNTACYASRGEKEAFVLSHGKNLLVLKMVGFGDEVIRYYKLEEMHAHVWIGHHRYPTKGRVWHPGGAHPFIGLNEALVHNGDFANYASITEYLAQRNIHPLFITDTEVSVQVFDLLYRTYGYPLEYVIEALAPTTERDFSRLSPEKQRIYKMIQTTHMHASPDGPWFFLVAQSDRGAGGNPVFRLTGITDTSMLRPQVFAWQEGEDEDGNKLSIGLTGSEKQAIDAALESLAATDGRFWGRADRYWNARGGSHTDGGAFVFSVKPNSAGKAQLELTDKFGRAVPAPTKTRPYHSNGSADGSKKMEVPDLAAEELVSWVSAKMPEWNYGDVEGLLKALDTSTTIARASKIELLTGLMDRRYATGNLRRSNLLSMYDDSFAALIEHIRHHPGNDFLLVHPGDGGIAPGHTDQTAVLDAREYDAEGEDSAARAIQELFKGGFRRFLAAHTKGHRFIGSGLGAESKGVRIDVYGSPGDYLASGIDGAEVRVHANGQDQLAQIMKSGKLVVHGDVGQTFMYGAKGGEAYVLGNAAGRPLINAVGRPRVVINGTCLDYLAESFMAGDPFNGGGFVILNGVTFDEDGRIISLDEPYPGSNLFSLASGGSLFVRDPHRTLTADQLNGGEFVELAEKDWKIIEPYLRENERLFGIPVERLLQVGGSVRPPGEIYRRIRPMAVRALQSEEAWVAGNQGKH